jgi:hypothetical protein
MVYSPSPQLALVSCDARGGVVPIGRHSANSRRRRLIALTAMVAMVVGLLLGDADAAQAWNDTGHQIIALIAWERLSDSPRSTVVDVLRQAPADSGLARLLAQDKRPWPARQREFFRRASTWPDRVRDLEPADRRTYHRPTWHYQDFFWRQGPHGPVDLPGLTVNPENVVERLEHFRGVLKDPGNSVGVRAIALGWLLHLVGDVHQPLHAGSRVTRPEPEGDLGGNLFRLGPSTENLHSYWDRMLDRAIPRYPNESTGAYLARAAALVVTRHPQVSLEGDLRPGKFEDWARESLAEAKRAYPPTLRRGQAPPATYAQWASSVAIERAARAGYRLAAILEEVYGH